MLLANGHLCFRPLAEADLKSGLSMGCGVVPPLVGVEAPLSLPLLPWNADPAPPPTEGVGRKAIGRITALPLSHKENRVQFELSLCTFPELNVDSNSQFLKGLRVENSK